MDFSISTKSEGRVLVPWEQLEYPNATRSDSYCGFPPPNLGTSSYITFQQGASILFWVGRSSKTGGVWAQYGTLSVARVPQTLLLVACLVPCEVHHRRRRR
jgi:hypothetical protein